MLLHTFRQGKWLEKLSEITQRIKGFDRRDLNLAFIELYKNEFDAEAFIAKPQEVQNDEVDDILRKYKKMPMSGSAGHKRNINNVCGDGNPNTL